MSWISELDAVDHKVLPPDPDVMAAIGLSHNLTSAIADLVDNSIDAKASSILIRFVMLEGKPASLLVADNGLGMTADQLDHAMTVGKRREYGGSDLGHFGMGLKSASFSQADVLTVLSAQSGGVASGRRWCRHTRDFTCDVIDRTQAADMLSSIELTGRGQRGTIVRWDGVREFPSTDNTAIVNDYLTRATQMIRAHLGIALHRVLSSGDVEVQIDVLDADDNISGPPQRVEPTDPFGYRRSGDPTYPKVLWALLGSRRVPLECHIWPARSEALGFKLRGNAEQHQGFYFYRNDRLLEVGGWKGVAIPHRRLQLARVAVDVSELMDLINLNMEKSAVQPRPLLMRAVEAARADDGTSFSDYLSAAEAAYRLGNVRDRSRQEVLRPGSGIAPAVKNAILNELPTIPGRPAVELRWKRIPTENFFEVDRPASTLWLNSRYRSAVLGNKRAGLNDAPLLKAALYLLLEDIFRGTAFGPRDKDNVELWQAILTAAAQAQNNE